MAVVQRSIELATQGRPELFDVTGQVSRLVLSCGVKNGLMVLFVPGSRAALLTAEWPEGKAPALLEALAEQSQAPAIQSALWGTQLALPVQNGQLPLSRWQKIVLVDLDNKPHRHLLQLQVVGE